MRHITQWKRKTILAVAVMAAASVYYTFNPATTVYFPPCPVYKLTGFRCPGCGSQRAIHSLLHGDFGQAFSDNPLVPPALLLVALLVYLEHFGGKNRFPRLHRFLSGSKFIGTLAAAIILFGIGRNIL
ncbi:MAG: DUF2752 domain-containing protein [Prevotellaceae bacterium]|jgi:hypothetical protein|nr:DUF2752 domain-containing protein [Prevotellaceae bacterium]